MIASVSYSAATPSAGSRGSGVIRRGDCFHGTCSNSAAVLLPCAADSRGGFFILPSFPGTLSAAADLWRRGLEVNSIPAACRDTHTTRQTQTGLLRCLLQDALRYLADAFQLVSSCSVAPASCVQCDTGATHERGKTSQELGNLSQGERDG